MTAKRVRLAIDKIRLASGLAVYDTPLTKATCDKCKRAYYWRRELVPKHCPWPDCTGHLQTETE